MSWLTTFDQLSAKNNGFIGAASGRPAFCYIRVSSDEQAEKGSGLERQIINCHEVARANDYRICKEHVFADDASGFEFEERPELSRMRKLYHTGQAVAVVMEDLDRLSRDADWHQGFLMNEMKKANLERVFWKPLGTRVEQAVRGAVAQEGMEQTKQRMYAGRLLKARSGRIPSNKRAYGYDYVDESGCVMKKPGRNTYYAINEQEAVWVKYMFNQLARGSTINPIVDYLNTLGPETTKKEKSWSASSVKKIVQNTVYKGEYVSNRQIGKTTKIRPREEWIIVNVPAIVDNNLWQRAQDMLEKNRIMATRNASENYLLTGLLRCSECGYSITGSKHGGGRNKSYVYYMCCPQRNPKQYKLRGITCTQPAVPREILDEAVWNAVCHMLLEPEILFAAFEAENNDTEALNQIDYLERQINAFDEEDEGLYVAYKNKAFDASEFADRRHDLKRRKLRIEQELKNLRSRMRTPEQIENEKVNIVRISELARQHGLTDVPFEDKKRIIKIVVRKIVVNAVENTFKLEGAINDVFAIADTSTCGNALNVTLEVDFEGHILSLKIA